MPMKDLAEQLLGPLVLPFRGVAYEIQPVDAETGLLLQSITSATTTVSIGGDINEDDLATLREDVQQYQGDLTTNVLGADVLAQMRADRVPFEVIKLATATVMIWTLQDREAAETYWNSGGQVPKANRAQRRGKKGGAKSGRRASAGTTSRSPK